MRRGKPSPVSDSVGRTRVSVKAGPAFNSERRSGRASQWRVSDDTKSQVEHAHKRGYFIPKANDARAWDIARVQYWINNWGFYDWNSRQKAIPPECALCCFSCLLPNNANTWKHPFTSLIFCTLWKARPNLGLRTRASYFMSAFSYSL